MRHFHARWSSPPHMHYLNILGGFQCRFFCASLLYQFGTLTCQLSLIAHLVLLGIAILIFSWLFYSLHMHGLTIVHRLTWCVFFSGLYILIFVYLIHLNMIDFICCILSCLSQHIIYSCYIPILCIIFLPSLYVDMGDIHVIYMTAILLFDTCIVCLCETHIYPFTSNSLVSVNLVFLDFVFDMRLVALFALRPS